MADPTGHSEVAERYIVIGSIGRGAFGEVKRAQNRETGEVVAIKRVKVRDPKAGIPDNLLREIKALQCIDHPNVTKLLDVFPEGSAICMVLEHCPTDLDELLKNAASPLDEAIVKCIMQQILRGLSCCHSSGIMHRDLKPSNILINSEGVIKLADFGLARYRAPELLYGARAYGPKVDMWAVGAIFAELLGLGPLFAGENDIDQLAKVQLLLGTLDESVWPQVAELPDFGKISFPQTEPVPLSEVLPDASGTAISLLEEMLTYNPKIRISAEDALLDDFFLTQPLPDHPDALATLIM